jgi:hypothetical protein
LTCQIIEALKHPETCSSLTLKQWEDCIRQARVSSLLAALYAVLQKNQLLDDIPERPRAHLFSSWVVHQKQIESLSYEKKWLQKALQTVPADLLLVKGAAYILADLPAAAGRMIGDIDILVPADRLDSVEAALKEAGWEPGDMNDYDERYYRRWMHEIPPLGHVTRGSTVDVHHTIIPPTANPLTNPEKLFSDSLEIAPHVRVLSPADMVIHSATHLFHEGEFAHGLRDLLDLDRLLRFFGENEPGFWEKLVPRAEELALARPLYYALHYATRIFSSPVPNQTLSASELAAPASRFRKAIMDFLFMRALMPEHPSCDDRFTATARFCLYVRSHYLRMPLYLLLPHLLRKAFVKRRPPVQDEEDVDK